MPGEKTYKCDICKKKYSSKSNLDRHTRDFHGGTRPSFGTCMASMLGPFAVISFFALMIIFSLEDKFSLEAIAWWFGIGLFISFMATIWALLCDEAYKGQRKEGWKGTLISLLIIIGIATLFIPYSLPWWTLLILGWIAMEAFYWTDDEKLGKNEGWFWFVVGQKFVGLFKAVPAVLGANLIIVVLVSSIKYIKEIVGFILDVIKGTFNFLIVVLPWVCIVILGVAAIYGYIWLNGIKHRRKKK